MLRWEESALVMGKIEALDVKGALRLASSSDSFAKATPWVKIMFTLWATQENVAKREAKHPPRPTDYFFQPPSSDITFPPQQLIAKLLVKNVKSFPNDSARGVSNLRPQHLKDLTPCFPKLFAAIQNLTSEAARSGPSLTGALCWRLYWFISGISRLEHRDYELETMSNTIYRLHMTAKEFWIYYNSLSLSFWLR